MKITQTLSQSTRLRLKPVGGHINLGELRAIVASAVELPDTARVYAEDLMKASGQVVESYCFRGLSIVDTVLEENPNV